MKLVTYPRSSPLLIITSIVLATIIALSITRLVFKFGYYASGLAALDYDEQRRREAPIDVQFTNPDANAADANALGPTDPNR